MSLQILLVEPERHAREGLRAILSADGYAVGVAEDMWAGLMRLCSQTFDLLLLDDDVRSGRHIRLSVLELLRFARRKHPATRGIIIATFEDDMRAHLHEPGVVAVLQKPLEVPRLRLELEALT